MQFIHRGGKSANCLNVFEERNGAGRGYMMAKEVNLELSKLTLGRIDDESVLLEPF